MKYILEEKDKLYVYSEFLKRVRVINLTSQNARDTENTHVIKKCIEQGERVPDLQHKED